MERPEGTPRLNTPGTNYYVVKIKEIIRNNITLFKSPLLFVTLMMLYINFAIQFG